MQRSEARLKLIRGASLAPIATVVLAMCGAVLLPASALANNLFSLDAAPTSTAPVVTDSAGDAYIAWESHASGVQRTMFCKIPPGGTCTAPQTLAAIGGQEPGQAFPVIGTQPGVVYVVGARYDEDDTAIWVSTTAGASFGAAKPIPSYSDKLGADDILINPNHIATAKEPTNDVFDISATDAGLGFSESGEKFGKASELDFTGLAFFIEPSSLGFTGTKRPVLAYWADETPIEIGYLVNNGGATSEQTNWEGPTIIKEGENPRLASGPDGLFMVSEDFLSGEGSPPTLELRRFEEGSKKFGAPIALSGNDLQGDPPGIYENPDTGALYIAWVAVNGAGSRVIELTESTDGGATFHGEREIASVKPSFTGPLRLGAGDAGSGWLTFNDEGGVEVADLNTQVKPTPLVLAPAAPPTPTAITTTQSGAGISAASLTVPLGTPVTDQARLAGTHAATATGTVTYQLYKDSKCTKQFGASSVASVLAGVGAHSATVKPQVGTYYWRAAYSGDAANAASTSACGSEVLGVATEDTHLGLPSSKICLSRRKFIVHPRAPQGVKLVSVEVLINGKLAKRGRLSNRATSVSLVGLPKGTFRISLITKSSKGRTYEDIRTFHTCVPGKHHKK